MLTSREKIVFAIRLLQEQAVRYGILTEVFIDAQVDEALAALDNLEEKGKRVLDKSNKTV